MVCGDEVQLHVARVSLGRGDAVAVDGHGAEVGAGAAHLSEAGLALVILHVDAADALQGVADVGVGELAYLVGGHHVADAHRVLLRGQGAALALEGAAHHDLLQLDAFAQGDVAFHGFPFGDGDGQFHRGIAHVADFYLIGADGQVGQCVESVDVADGTRVEGFDEDGGTRQGLSGFVDNAAADAALFGLVYVLFGVLIFVGQHGRQSGHQ